MSSIVLRGGVEVEGPLELALRFLAAYSSYDAVGSPAPDSLGESDLRAANRGGARISAAEIAATLERRAVIERALSAIPSDTSLTDAAGAVPWAELTRLFEAFGGIRGIGFAKMTKALHPKRPALIPMLDSVVQTYLADDDPGPRSAAFGDRAVALVRGYKRDLDRNSAALTELRHELAVRGHRLTDVRILDVVIWSVGA